MDLKTLIDKGQKYFENGDVGAAETHFKYVLAWQPDNVVALNNLGVVAYQQGEPERAKRYFSAALEADGENADALLNLADLHLKQNQLQEAAGFLERCGRSHPTESLFKLLAVVHHRLGNKDISDHFLSNSQPWDLQRIDS